MTKLERLQETIAALDKDEMKRLAEWFDELQSDLWDKRIEADAEAGRLDKLAEKALADHRAGRTTPL